VTHALEMLLIDGTIVTQLCEAFKPLDNVA